MEVEAYAYIEKLASQSALCTPTADVRRLLEFAQLAMRAVENDAAYDCQCEVMHQGDPDYECPACQANRAMAVLAGIEVDR